MPIPTTHLVRDDFEYIADDGITYNAKFESALIVGTNSSIPQGIGGTKTKPPNLHPRGAWIETTNGVDSQARPHKYRRFVPCLLGDTSVGGPFEDGKVIAAFEGCAWVVRGYRGETLRVR